MSVTPDITEPFPALLTARQQTAAADASGIAWDLSIGGVGLVLQCTEQDPYRRETAPVQKEQFDASGEAGENTLDGYWIRSQTSWHHGAGAAFYEPGSRDEQAPSKYRFGASSGVDVWTPGQLSLVRALDRVGTAGGEYGGLCLAGGFAWMFDTSDPSRLLSFSEASGVATAYVFPDALYDLTTDGSSMYAASFSGVWKWSPVGGPVAPTMIWSGSGAGSLRFVKDRLLLSRPGLGVYGLPTSGTGAVYDGTHLLTDRYLQGFVETPDAILGFDRGSIFALTATYGTGTLVPSLSAPREVASLPGGETVRCLSVSVGRYLGVASSQGFRVADVDVTGALRVGPLLWQGPCDRVASSGRFFHVLGADGLSRVDLSTQLADGPVFAYALDVPVEGSPGVGLATSPGVSGQRAWLACGDGLFLQSETDLVSEGWLESGVVRFGTVANKAWRSLDVGVSVEGGALVVVAIDGVDLFTLSGQSVGSGLPLGGVPDGPGLRYTVRLRRDVDVSSTGPSVEFVAIRALPSVPRRRYVQYPVVVDNQVKDRNGNLFGFDGYGWTVLRGLEELESSSAIVQFHDYVRGESFAATVEKIDYRQPETYKDTTGNTGGRALVTVKTL